MSDVIDNDGPTMDDLRPQIMEAWWEMADTGQRPPEAKLKEFYDAARRSSAHRVDSQYSVGYSVVYYFRVGNRIKIGYSASLPKRIEQLTPEEVLGWEYGDVKLERQRHRQFKQFRTHNEWFRDCPEIRAHIATLESHGRA